MLEIGQWVILVSAILVCLLLLLSLTKLFVRALLLVLGVVAIVWALCYFNLIPEPCQKYVDEVLSEETMQKVKSILPECRPTSTVSQDQGE